MLSSMPTRAPFLSAKDCMECFGYFDADGTGVMEYPEMMKAFETMLGQPLEMSEWEDKTFTPAEFRRLAEAFDSAYPQFKVAANLMKFIRENREAGEDDAENMPEKVLKKLFDKFDADGSGEMDFPELISVFMLLNIPTRFLINEQNRDDGKVSWDEFVPMIRKIDQENPDLGVDDKINDFVAGLGGGIPDRPNPDDNDPENDPADVAEAEDAPPNKKALLVGINYIGSSCELGGCINDARNHYRVLTEKFGFAEENILLLTEDQDDDSKIPTAEVMRAGFDWLLDGAGEGDFLFFAYSGHGSQMPCQTGEEPDGKNEILCPHDLQDDWNANSITDNYLHQVFAERLPDGVKCLCVYDCCHSASMEDLSCTRDLKPPGEEVDQKSRYMEPPPEHAEMIVQAAVVANLQKRDLDGSPSRPRSVVASKKVWSISGCQDNQTSADATIGGVRQGALTWGILECLEEQDYHYRYDRLLTNVRKKMTSKNFTQIPAMGASQDSFFRCYYMASPP